MINITKFDIVTLCATLSEENNVFENNIYLHFVYTIEVFLKQLVTGHPVVTCNIHQQQHNKLQLKCKVSEGDCSCD